MKINLLISDSKILLLPSNIILPFLTLQRPDTVLQGSMRLLRKKMVPLLSKSMLRTVCTARHATLRIPCRTFTTLLQKVEVVQVTQSLKLFCLYYTLHYTWIGHSEIRKIEFIFIWNVFISSQCKDGSILHFILY